MRRRTGVGRHILCCALVSGPRRARGPAAATAAAVKFTFIGDSKAAAIEYSPPAKRLLARGHTVRRDLKVCRRLVAPSCTYQGVTPLTALQAIKNYGRTLGPVLVIDVGYNDSSATYRSQMEQVVRAAKARGVKGIVWVNLRVVPGHPDYRRINAIIARGGRAPADPLPRQLERVHTRTSLPRGSGGDGIHLTSAGAVGLVRLVRRYVAARGPGPTRHLGPPAGAGRLRHRGPRRRPSETPTTTGEDEEAALTAQQPARRARTSAARTAAPAASAAFLVFAGGAALMLFLVFVTVKRRGAT